MRRFLLPFSLIVSCSMPSESNVDGVDVSVEDLGSLDMAAADAMPPADAGADGQASSDASPELVEDLGMAVACTAGSRAGVCLDVSECDGARESVPGFCPGPTEIQCCVPTDDTMCDENPDYEDMPRPNEGLVETAGDGGCPDGMAAVDTFCVDRYEAALVEILADGGERHWSPYFNPVDRRVRAVSVAGAVPQGYITGVQADAACQEAGKRLCSDSEWLRACQGEPATTYPYGDTRQPGVCNDARDRHPVVDYFESTDPSIWSKLGNACINQQDESLARTGAHAGCVTDDGLFDMMGNLHEWTADPAGTFRGGFYADTAINGQGCLYATTAHNTAHWDYSTGFRCCADRL